MGLREPRVKRRLVSQAPRALPSQREEGKWSVAGGTRGQRAASKNDAGMGTFLWSWDAFHTTH